jgi:large subunit ribosomal protein L2
VGTTVVAGAAVAAKTGNAMPLSAVPLGTPIHNIELIPGNGGKVFVPRDAKKRKRPANPY